MGLSPLTRLPTNLNHTESKSYSENSSINNRVEEEISWADGLPLINISSFTDPSCAKIEWCRNHYNLSNKVDNEIPRADRLLSTDPNHTESENCSDHCNMSDLISKELPVTENKQPNHSNPTCI